VARQRLQDDPALREDFPGAKVFKLEENYRSTQTILDVANELVAQQRAPPKKLFTKRAGGEKVTRIRPRPSAPKRAT
jgi:DNA helicase-2/ATP-dependent DNA helicase PcrA